MIYSLLSWFVATTSSAMPNVSQPAFIAVIVLKVFYVSGTVASPYVVGNIANVVGFRNRCIRGLFDSKEHFERYSWRNFDELRKDLVQVLAAYFPLETLTDVDADELNQDDEDILSEEHELMRDPSFVAHIDFPLTIDCRTLDSSTLQPTFDQLLQISLSIMRDTEAYVMSNWYIIARFDSKEQMLQLQEEEFVPIHGDLLTASRQARMHPNYDVKVVAHTPAVDAVHKLPTFGKVFDLRSHTW